MTTQDAELQAAEEMMRAARRLRDAIVRDSDMTLEEWVTSRAIQGERADRLRGDPR